jgi:hypothetical protein
MENLILLGKEIEKTNNSNRGINAGYRCRDLSHTSILYYPRKKKIVLKA